MNKNINKYIKLITITLVMVCLSLQSKAQAVCDCSSGTFTAYAVAEPGTFEITDYSQIYILTDGAGNVIASNTTGNFPDLMSNTDYNIYATNVANDDVADFQNNLTTIEEVSSISGVYANYCYELNPNSASYNCVCTTPVCPEIGTIKTTGPICDNETFDITATGITNVLQAENNETDFQILFGYYNGSIPNPNPYVISPDVLFNMGNVVTPINGSADLTGMGLSLNPGTYTVVAYLSTAPVDVTCQPVAVTEVIINGLPTVNITGELDICIDGTGQVNSDETTALFADVGFDSYLWSTGQTNRAIIVNAGGDYTVTVTDANGCSNDSTVTVTESDCSIGVACPEITNVISGSPVCVGEFIDVTVTGITNILQSENGEADFGILIGAYNGEISNPDPYTTAPDIVLNFNDPIIPNGNTATLNGIGPLNNSGSFTIVAYLSGVPQDVSCRPVVTTVVIINESPMETEPNNPFTACEGESVIFVAPDGYNYLWATDAVTQQVTVFNETSLPVTITNTAGCSQTLIYESQLIDNPNEAQPRQVSICGANEVTLNGPDGYNYQWANGATTQSIAVSAVGTYELTISNNADCTQVLTYQVVQQGLNLPDPQPIGICGVQNLTLEGPDGFTYQWSTGETTQSIIVTSLGSYTLTVTDTGGCSQELVYQVNDSGNLNLSNPPPKEICQGEFATLTGPPGFSYLWSNGSTMRIILVNAAGLYTLEVIDTDGCSQILNYLVQQSDAPNEAQPQSVIACAGEVVNLQAPGGYSYNWDSGEQSSNLNATESGTYNVDISSGCSQTLSFEVTFLPLPTITAIGQNPSACAINDGIITLSFSGISDGFYNLTSKAGNFENVLVMNGTATISGLGDGFYNFISITSMDGCTAITDNVIELTSPDFVEQPTVSGISQYCEGDGVKSVIAKGETGAVFTWYANEDLTTIIYTGSNFVPMSNTQTVYVTQTISGICESAATPFTITVNPLPVLQSQTIIECTGANEMAINLSSYEEAIGVTGGSWADNAGAIVDPSAYMFTNFTSITYTVSNDEGCVASASVKLIINNVEVNTQAVSVCDNVEGNFIDLLSINNWNDEIALSNWTTGGELVLDPSNVNVTQDGQVFELITTSDGPCDATNLLIVNIEEAPIIEAVASCRNSNDQNQFFVDVFTTKNPSFNSIIIGDGNTQQTALGNNQVTFGPYTHSGSGLADITYEAYFEENPVCPVTVTANEVLCGPAQSCDCSNPASAGTILSQSEPGTFRNDNHTQIYALTDVDGNIVDSNNTGLFTGLVNGDYSVYAINVDNFDAYALNVAIGTEANISTFIPSKSYNNFCYEISDAANYMITCDCLPVTCPSIYNIKTTGDICAGETFDITVTGITDVAQAQNNETDFDILIGYYSGFVAWPDPYTTAPDGLFNNGNPVTINNGEAQLDGMGASLPGDNYTIVTYLSPAPSDAGCIPMDRAFVKIHESPTLNPTIDPICVGNNGVVHPNISGGLFPYVIDWTNPSGETFTVSTYTIHLATLTDAGTYTVAATDVRGCSNTVDFDVQVLDGDLGYQEVYVCENIAGGDADAMVDLTVYENGFGFEGGTWIDESNNAVTDPTNVNLNGAFVFRFEYHLDDNMECQGEGVLLLNILSADSPYCGDPVTCDCSNLETPLSLFASVLPGSFNNVGYSNVYILADSNANILSFNDSGLFTELIEETDYSIYTINVNDADLALFEAALSTSNVDDLGTQTGDFTDLSYTLITNANFNETCDCSIPCLADAGDSEPQLEGSCDCSTEDAPPLSITATVQPGSYNTINHSILYLLVDVDLNVINFNNNGIFTLLNDQTSYNIYVANISNEDLGLFENELANGVSIEQLNSQSSGFTDLCYDVNTNSATYSQSCDCIFEVPCLADAGDSEPQLEASCDCSVEDVPLTITATVPPGSYNTIDHSIFYLLVDVDLNIIYFNSTGVFAALNDQTSYTTYVVNFANEDLSFFENELANGISIQQLNNQSGGFADLCYDVNNNSITYSEDCGCDDPPVNTCIANAGSTFLETEGAVFCAGDDVGPFETDQRVIPSFLFEYIWIATDGAPNYNILSYTLNMLDTASPDPDSAIGNFENLSSGSYCIHGFCFEGTLTDFENYINDNNIENGVQIATAISEGEICADLIIDDCIEIEVKDIPTANINSSANLCNVAGGDLPTEIDLNSLIVEGATGAWYPDAGGTQPISSTIVTAETLGVGTINFYYIIDDETCGSIDYEVSIDVLDCVDQVCTYNLDNNDIVCNADGTFNLALTVTLANALSDEFYIAIDGIDYGPYTDVDNDGTELVNVENVTASSGINAITIADGQSGQGTPPPTIFISELHYDNVSSDVNEGIEVTALAGTDLSNYTLELYNGNGGGVYNTMTLSGIVTEEANGYGTAAFIYPLNSIQNGPDAVALIDVSDAENPDIIEFIGYELEGSPFFATEGTAVGLQPMEIGVEEPGAEGESLQLTDLGWVGPVADSFGSLNNNLTLQTTGVVIECSYGFNVDFPSCGPCSINVTATAVNCENNQFFIDVAVDANNPISSQFTIGLLFFGFETTNYGNFDYSSGTVNIGPLPADGFSIYEFVIRDVESSDCQNNFMVEALSCAPRLEGPIEESEVSTLNEIKGKGDNIPVIYDDPLDVTDGFEKGGVGALNEIPGKGDNPIEVGTINALRTTIDYLRPNPATNNLFIGINAKVDNDLHFEVVDATGRIMARNMQVINKGINEIELDVSAYKPGIYFIKMLQGDTLLHKIFIKE